MNKKQILGLFGMLAATAGMCATESAMATATPKSQCSVNNVFYDDGRLAITCSGSATKFYGVTSTSCANLSNSEETLRAWQMQAQASLLSGKKLTVTYENATGSCQNLIYSVELY